jgi:agmatinase
MEKALLHEELMQQFDPNGAGIKGQLFGLPFTPENASLVIIPVPWEVTVSYHSGTSLAPTAILDASSQIDLLVKDIPDAWKLGVSMFPVQNQLLAESTRLRHLALQYLSRFENTGIASPHDPVLNKINEACENLNIFVKTTALRLLKQGKMVGLLGGDHSTPLGLIRALAEHHDKFGILQIDAHADLRKAYQGFAYSHASVMYNALKLRRVSRLVQVGVRDFCEEEMQLMDESRGRILTFFDEDIKSEMYQGRSWDNICEKIIASLPEKVYISFDIDGLDPKLCPGTGTPVVGGLEFTQTTHLIKKIVKAGRKIIGFDLNEVSPSRESDWDANVGARVLWNLCNLMAVSRNKLRFASTTL